ncbi:hypothetical protein NDU88_005159 [Pleurodeles waltl]|uniref:Myb/SANT-like DNA-binding domain-containing protein n=1 Tax=Pleurodeles waltl TaxID=8319 RepID=A0AAV7UHS6_PLEWA|nr:hypothetical protein NDU88_005159 [Pleurodeles waltl]
MAAASGERAPAFTSEELEKLVDGVLPQYTLLYGPPDQQVSAHQKRDIWRAIAKEVRTLGAHQRRGTHCRKRWEDIRRCSKKTAEAQLGMASQRGRGARRTTTPLMFQILAVAYPELDGGGTRRSQIGPEERGDVEQDKEPSLKQVAPGEVPETGTMRMRETVLAEVAQRSPTSPETNLESRAMQVRVPWTQAWLCTKDFCRKCTGAGVAAKSRFPAMQLFGACGCRGKIPSPTGDFFGASGAERRQATPTACTSRKTVEKAAGSALQSCSSRLCYYVAGLQASSAVSSRFLIRR